MVSGMPLFKHSPIYIESVPGMKFWGQCTREAQHGTVVSVIKNDNNERSRSISIIITMKIILCI